MKFKEYIKENNDKYDITTYEDLRNASLLYDKLAVSYNQLKELFGEPEINPSISITKNAEVGWYLKRKNTNDYLFIFDDSNVSPTKNPDKKFNWSVAGFKKSAAFDLEGYIKIELIKRNIN